MNAYLIFEDGSIRSAIDGKIIFLSTDEFVEEIIQKKCCFICGANPGSKEFNDEHVIPNWILRDLDMHNQRIELPNNTFINYGAYKIPCCKDCNETLGARYETPISNLFKKNYVEIIDLLQKDESIQYNLFLWMSLLYFKTHLKDTFLIAERDRRRPADNIGDYYDWSGFHHVHCLTRVHYTNAIVNKDVYGSLFILPMLRMKEPFDYMDSLGASTVGIQVGEIAVIAVLNDCKVVQSAMNNILQRIDGPLSPLQLKELFAHAVYINTGLKERPLFHSTVTGKGYEIVVTKPDQWEILREDNGIPSVQDLLHFYAEKYIHNSVENRDWILNEIKEGRMRYLFNEEGAFVQYPHDD